MTEKIKIQKIIFFKYYNNKNLCRNFRYYNNRKFKLKINLNYFNNKNLCLKIRDIIITKIYAKNKLLQ